MATTVVSLIKLRLSPKKAPPTQLATIIGSVSPDGPAIPTAIGTRATIVPTLVPILIEMKHEAKKSPGRSIDGGNNCIHRLTVASTAPICRAVAAKAPAKIKIHIIKSRLSCPAPLLYIVRRSSKGVWRSVRREKMDVVMKTMSRGTLEKPPQMKDRSTNIPTMNNIGLSANGPFFFLFVCLLLSGKSINKFCKVAQNYR